MRGVGAMMRVRDVMALLPEEQRFAIMLVCVNGMSYGEAAAELDIPIGTLISRLSPGRLELG
ncbi:sigma factor-like helix-turn-helix DNA-binding protein [Skermanella aerolata]|nr:sigma factor-like helix-turn-helix DNA-binding protein [Skermanella aerolata]